MATAASEDLGVDLCLRCLSEHLGFLRVLWNEMYSYLKRPLRGSGEAMYLKEPLPAPGRWVPTRWAGTRSHFTETQSACHVQAQRTLRRPWATSPAAGDSSALATGRLSLGPGCPFSLREALACLFILLSPCSLLPLSRNRRSKMQKLLLAAGRALLSQALPGRGPPHALPSEPCPIPAPSSATVAGLFDKIISIQ